MNHTTCPIAALAAATSTKVRLCRRSDISPNQKPLPIAASGTHDVFAEALQAFRAHSKDQLSLEIFEGLSELFFFFLPKNGDLLDGTARSTGRLLRMLPLLSFPKPFVSSFPFLQCRSWTVRPYCQFRGHHHFSSKSSEDSLYLPPVLTNSLNFYPPEKTVFGCSKRYTRTLEKRETVPESSRKTPGSILRSLYRCFWQSRRVKRVCSASKPSSESPEISFQHNWSMGRNRFE